MDAQEKSLAQNMQTADHWQRRQIHNAAQAQQMLGTTYTDNQGRVQQRAVSEGLIDKIVNRPFPGTNITLNEARKSVNPWLAAATGAGLVTAAMIAGPPIWNALTNGQQEQNIPAVSTDDESTNEDGEGGIRIIRPGVEIETKVIPPDSDEEIPEFGEDAPFPPDTGEM